MGGQWHGGCHQPYSQTSKSRFQITQSFAASAMSRSARMQPCLDAYPFGLTAIGTELLANSCQCQLR